MTHGLGLDIQYKQTKKWNLTLKTLSIVVCLVLPTMTFPKDFQKIDATNGTINIYGLFPLYKEELEFKIEKGFDEFIKFLIKNNTKEIIDFNRVNYCTEKTDTVDKLKRWTKGLFNN